MNQSLRLLRDEWYRKADALARQRGERDVETPNGDLRGNGRKIEGVGVGAVEFHVHCEKDGSFELATEKRRFLHSHAFSTDGDREIWALHVDGLSNREIARRLWNGKAKTSVARRLGRLLAAFEKRDARKPGRPRDPESLRSENMRLEVLLSTRTALALDHLRVVLGVSDMEITRRALEDLARRLPQLEQIRTGT